MIIDHLSQTIQLKICYFGPALSGKTTTLKSLFKHFGKEDRVLSIDSSIRRTLFFDYGTITFENKQWLLKLHIYSTTGQDFYIITRPITLRAIDGIIFVADLQNSAYYRNLTSWNELCNYFEDDFEKIPKILAFNKQDLDDKFSPSEFLENINSFKYNNLKTKNTTALFGEGVVESFEELLELILKKIYKTQMISLVE
ncbi:MAG: GTPase domain-containing protein [Candidatus Lokiarchaeota archaeon]|nr:GTPase domain-containing protein [Candidatus Lokiarchaeota archaeon]